MTERWHGPLLAGCALFFAVVAAAADTDGDYRLAGTIELEAGGFIAIVDDGDGRQHIVHAGDQFDIGEVVSIGDRKVLIQTDNGLVVLSLEGIAAPPMPEAEWPPVVTAMFVDSELLQRLQGISGGDEHWLTRKVLQELDLPEELTLREAWFRDEQYSEMSAALPGIRSALQEGEVVHLFFEKGGPVDEIYLKPARPDNNE